MTAGNIRFAARLARRCCNEQQLSIGSGYWATILNLDFVIFKCTFLTKLRSWADGSQMPARQQAVDVGRNY
jgi:hypothetical protein